MFKKVFCFIVFFVCLTFIFSVEQKTSAQQTNEDIGISVSPVKFELEGKPGDSIEGKIKYYNYTPTKKKLYLHIYNFAPQGESNVPQFLYNDTRAYGTTLKDWIDIADSQINVDPVEPVKIIPTIVTFRISIPTDAEAGGYYAAVIQSQQKSTKDDIESSGTVISPESACLFILNVAGEVTRVGTSESFVVVDPYEGTKKSKVLFEFPPVQFIARIRNSGTTHFKPQGNIFLYKGNSQIASFQVNEAEGNVLRDSVRMFEEEMWGEDSFLYKVPKLDENGARILDRNGNVKTSLKINWDRLSKIPFGKYRAKLSLVYDDNGEKKTIEDEVSFWIIPWRLLLIILLILYAIGGLILYKKLRKKGTKKYHDS